MVTSNVLTLTILPDDPEWDERRLADTRKILEDPQARARYDRAIRHARTLPSKKIASDSYYHYQVYQTELAKAQRALNAIDTEVAIRERIRQMRMNSREDINMMREFNTAASVNEPLLSSTTRPDIVVASMRERAEMPEFDVDYNYVAWWSRFLVQQEHPELFRGTEKTQDASVRELVSGYSAAVDAATREIAAILQSNLASKKGDALDPTSLTLKVVISRLRPQ
jgi:hypothetical protein